MLPAAFRLSDKDAFSKTFQEGYYASLHEFGLKWRPNQLSQTRIGFAAGKKIFPKASMRNRAKRIAREAVHHHLFQLRSGFDIIILYRHKPEHFILTESIRALGTLLAKHNLLNH